MRTGIGTAMALAAATLLSQPAFSQDQEMASCREALQESWANLVRAPMPGERRVLTIPLIGTAPKVRAGAARSPQQNEAPTQTPTSDPLAAELEQLAQLCAGDRVALNDIGLLRAMRLRDLGETDEALALLGGMDVRAGDRVFGLFHAELLKAHTRASSLAAAMPDVLDRHEALLLAAGMSAEAPFAVHGIMVRAYRRANPQDGWLLIAVHPDGKLETIVAQRARWANPGEVPPLELTNFKCKVSSEFFETDGLLFDEQLTLAQISVLLDRHFSDPERAAGSFFDDAGVPDFCPNLADMVPGFGNHVQFTGAEYRDRSLGFTEQDLLLVLQSDDPEARREATEYLFDHPQVVEPIHLIYGIVNLIADGDMERATFWYYIWQTRTRPWMGGGGTVAQLRGALAATIGPVLLEWSGSDYHATLDLWRRAIRYELNFPLYDGRATGVSAAEWADSVAAAREQNGEEAVFASMPDEETWNARRRENGLGIGPWQAPGRPLRDAWR